MYDTINKIDRNGNDIYKILQYTFKAIKKYACGVSNHLKNKKLNEKVL